MPKNIVICADGTGNTAIKGRGTNVFKLYEAIDQNGHRADPSLDPQVAIYHDGVGSEGMPALQQLSGFTGLGIARNVKHLYLELSRLYDVGDQLYLFGFSRGALTVRMLNGVLGACGVLDVSRHNDDKSLHAVIDEAWRTYRRRFQTIASRLVVRKHQTDDAFRQRWAIRDPEYAPSGQVMVRFLGVWDTVDSRGIPAFDLSRVINAFAYALFMPDTHLSPRVQRGCHALALDEERQLYEPLLWDQFDPPSDQVSQVWFTGAHSNVGGGYPRQGLSLVSLNWMMDEAEKCGLRFNQTERLAYREHSDGSDKLYNSRRGLNALVRWRPRNVQNLCRRSGVVPVVHESVLERIARNTDGYSPVALPPDFDVSSQHLSKAAIEQIQAIVRKIDPVRATRTYYRWLTVARAATYIRISAVALTCWTAGRLARTLIAAQNHWTIEVSRLVVLFMVYLIGEIIGATAERRIREMGSAVWREARRPLRQILGI